MLTVEGLTVRYGAVHALREVSFTAAAGKITAVLGANGAGKSSLLRAISGQVRSSGTIEMDGELLTGRPVEHVVRLGVAHVPEGRGVITELTVAENLVLGGLWRAPRRALAADLDEVYTLFPPLSSRRDKPADTLSGGERQMLALGRALLAKPRLLLLDEPSLGLAPQTAAQIMAVVRRLRDEQRLTVLLVEQNARSALSVADRGLVLNVGRLVADGDPAELDSDEQLRHAYLGF